ncbi:hypothetical protein G7Y89_g7801 [Cudoniella acicularis]|uniref:Polygalacturonase n=1 Tax=Cudoniella acicularis TaxID=354080 RepID=A0A8H4RKI6_9HELO|nr:hypothetical protein G7Y89_g7801 [Cudoniella acicularis]
MTKGTFSDSATADGTGSEGLRKTRTSQSTTVPQDEVVRCIEDRALHFQGFDTPRTHLEPLQLVQYFKGQNYHFHTDWFSAASQTTSEVGGNRLTSFFVYVEAGNVTGGGTNFPILDAPKDDRWCEFVDCDESFDNGVTFKPLPGNDNSDMKLLLQLLVLFQPAIAAVLQIGSACTVTPLSSSSTRSLEATDDTPQILDAFKKCGKDGSIEFTGGTYHIGQVMDTIDLRNCDISLHGTFIWSTDIKYWLSHSISVTYAGRSTAWRIGGTNITMRGHGDALFDGNGQLWYDQNKNAGNQDGRPISLTIWKATNILVDGITWRQPQFWHTFVAHSQNVTMTNLDMSAISNSQWKTVNTDGTDTWNSRDVVISNWTVTCGDDCISVKGNSTNVRVSNVVCHESGGMVIGSMGSTSQPDFVDDVVFENITLTHSSNAAWIKTYPGQGHVRNVLFKDIRFTDVNQPIYISPCIYSYKNCDSSRLQISNVRWENIVGTARYNVGAGMHCSAAAKCQNLTFSGIDIKQKSGAAVEYLCSNIENEKTSGLTCTGSCPANWEQQMSGPH